MVFTCINNINTLKQYLIKFTEVLVFLKPEEWNNFPVQTIGDYISKLQCKINPVLEISCDDNFK